LDDISDAERSTLTDVQSRLPHYDRVLAVLTERVLRTCKPTATRQLSFVNSCKSTSFHSTLDVYLQPAFYSQPSAEDNTKRKQEKR